MELKMSVVQDKTGARVTHQKQVRKHASEKAYAEKNNHNVLFTTEAKLKL